LSTTTNKPHPSRIQSSAKTVQEVARRAGVSASTVSRVTNGNASVDKRLAKRVWAAIEELGYAPNPQARALVSGRSRTLGLLISEITNPFYPELIQSFEDIAGEYDFEVMVGSTISNKDRAKLFITRLIQRRVEGVAVMTFRVESPLLDGLIAQRIPLVSVVENFKTQHSLLIEIDYAQGFNQAARHLAALGHKKIAFISGQMIHVSDVRRRDAFSQAIRSFGLRSREEWIFKGDHSFEAGARGAEYFLGLAKRPTAIVCANDLMAIGALSFLFRKQIKVPQQMSVVGLDDIHMAEFVSPALTTVRLSRTDLARSAFNAIQILRGESGLTESNSPHVSTSLVVRQSTGHPPKERS
jgi:DNA-binding LacI/PurR family transcriptional regulator